MAFEIIARRHAEVLILKARSFEQVGSGKNTDTYING